MGVRAEHLQMNEMRNLSLLCLPVSTTQICLSTPILAPASRLRCPESAGQRRGMCTALLFPPMPGRMRVAERFAMCLPKEQNLNYDIADFLGVESLGRMLSMGISNAI